MKESEARFHSLYENSFDAILLTKPDGSILAANPAAEKMFGMTQEEITKAGREGIIVKDEQLESALKERRQKGKVRSEFTFIRKDGSTFLGEATSSLFTDADGSVKTSMIIRDISERKNAEEALKMASIYNRSLIEASLDPLVTIGPDGKINDVNTATELVTGYPRDELVGTDFSDYFTEPQKAKSGYQRVFREGEVRDYPLEIKHKNGKVTPVLYNASVYNDVDGKVIGIFAAARDITERKQAEKGLEAERQRFIDVMEMLPAYVILLTQDYHVAFANRFFRERFGEDCGKRCYEYLFGLTEPCENCETYKVLKTGAPHHWEWTGPDGRNYDIHDFPFKDTDGSLLIMEVGIDITERKKAEEQLKEIITELERSNKELQSFAYITSHDLQEPLRTMGSYAGLLKYRYGGQLDSDADDFIDYMVSGASRLQEMIKGLLGLFSCGNTRRRI